MPLTPFFREEIFNRYVRDDTTYTPTSDQIIRLHDDDPGASGADNEVADTGYSEVNPYTGGWDAPSASTTPVGTRIANTALVSFGTADGSFTATHFSVWDTNNPENPLWVDELSTPVPFNAGNDIEFPAGNLILGLEGRNPAS